MPDQAQPLLCCALSWEGQILPSCFAWQGLCTLPGQAAVTGSTLRRQAAEVASSGQKSRSSLSCIGVAASGLRQVHTGADWVDQRAPAQASGPEQAL